MLYLLHTSSSQSAPCWQSKTLKAFNKLRCWEAWLDLLGRGPLEGGGYCVWPTAFRRAPVQRFNMEYRISV